MALFDDARQRAHQRLKVAAVKLSSVTWRELMTNDF